MDITQDAKGQAEFVKLKESFKNLEIKRNKKSQNGCDKDGIYFKISKNTNDWNFEYSIIKGNVISIRAKIYGKTA